MKMDLTIEGNFLGLLTVSFSQMISSIFTWFNILYTEVIYFMFTQKSSLFKIHEQAITTSLVLFL